MVPDLCSPVLDKQLPLYHTVRFEVLLLTKWTTLTPWSIVVFEKLTALQAIKTITGTLWNPTVRYRFHTRRPHVLTVRKITPAHPLQHSQLSILILPWHLALRLPSGLLFPDFPIETQYSFIISSKHYRGADKSLARPTSRCILFDGENISFDASLVYIYIYIYIYIYSTNIPPIMIINRIYELQNILSL